MNSPYIISQGDSQAFYSLKLTILNRLLVLLDTDLELSNFRIQVTVPNRSQRRGIPVPLQLGTTPLSQLLVIGITPNSLNSSPSLLSIPLVGYSSKYLGSYLSKRGSS